MACARQVLWLMPAQANALPDVWLQRRQPFTLGCFHIFSRLGARLAGICYYPACASIERPNSGPQGMSTGAPIICRAPELQTGDEKTRESSKRKWFEDLKKAKEQELEKLGLDPSQVRRQRA